jgi:hypothetical protein
LVVATMAPDSPTAKQLVELGQSTPRRLFPWGSGFCQNQVPDPVRYWACAEATERTRKKAKIDAAATAVKLADVRCDRIQALQAGLPIGIAVPW